MIHTTLATYLALNKIDGFGVRYFNHFEQYFQQNGGNMVDMLKFSDQALIALNWKPQHITQWRNLSWKVIETELEWAEKNKQDIIYWHDPRYPTLLKEIHRPPIVLYVKGELEALNRISIAIVGTRHPTSYGENNARLFTQKLAELNICIVSGLAIGIDGIAHKTALSHPAGTVAVIATGLDQVYPRRHYQLSAHIEQNGAIVSEFPFKTSPRAENFPRRNRIISGLSQGVLIIEAAVKSGSLITARYAMEQGRDVFAIPGDINNIQTQGCHALIQQGAVLVNHIDDILQEMRLLTFTHPISNNTNAESAKNAEHEKNYPLLTYMHSNIALSIDQCIEKSQLAPEIILHQLLNLELLELVQKSPNGGYLRMY